eukprot:TRINITY_DN49065_c0_g1_i1.p1 TRINITY_DN49065_c0_g1~~TRINITY_DN49065_c0_g1_i1.p1  ORF type:complete len:207 (+),score=10.67 TRINITY_DN49065_c0_g1_i1:71-691(+)
MSRMPTRLTARSWQTRGSNASHPHNPAPGDETIDRILPELVELLGIDACALVVPMGTQHKVRWYAIEGTLSPSREELKHSMLFKHPRTADLLVVKDTMEDPTLGGDVLVGQRADGIRFYVEKLVLGHSGNTVLGTLCLAHRQPCDISEECKGVLEQYASRISDALHAEAGQDDDHLMPHMELRAVKRMAAFNRYGGSIPSESDRAS